MSFILFAQSIIIALLIVAMRRAACERDAEAQGRESLAAECRNLRTTNRSLQAQVRELSEVADYAAQDVQQLRGKLMEWQAWVQNSPTFLTNKSARQGTAPYAR